MPCRSSRASISFRPRESCERSRRPMGASGGAGGASGFGGSIILEGGTCLDGAGFAAAAISATGVAAGGLAARSLFRSGFVCFVTLSHSARSSSLKPRLRRGGAANSGIEGEGGRFIGGDDNDDSNAGAARRGPA
jgi:hypothetical protein